VTDNTGLNTISPAGSQFLPLSFWYPTPNSWFFARGADYAPVKVQVGGTNLTVVSAGAETAGAFESKFTLQPFLLAGNWDRTEFSGVSIYLPKGATADEQKRGSEVAALAAEAKTFIGNVLGKAPEAPLRVIAVRRGAGFASGGTILFDEGVLRRSKIDSLTAQSVAEAVVKMWLGDAVSITDDGSGVIREGLSRFIATQFIESKYGKDVADIERMRQRIAYASVSRRDAPLNLVAPLDDYYYPAVANKGAMVWRVLNRKAGNDDFFSALRTGIQSGRVTLADLRLAFAEHKAFVDYMFDQVTDMNLQAGLPIVAGSETRVALRNTGGVDVTVNVAATMASGETTLVPTTVRAGTFGEVAFRSAGKITRIEIDPEKLYPQTDYSDDIAPRETTDSDLLLAVKRDFDRQLYPAAEKTARVILREYPRYDDVRVLLGRTLLAQNKNSEAEREFRAVIDEKLPTARSLAWAVVGLAETAARGAQNAQAIKYAEEAIRADAEYGASLAARTLRNRLNAAPTNDESIKAFFAQFDRAAISNRKSELEALAIAGDATRFVNGVTGQTVEWKTTVQQVDRMTADTMLVESMMNIKLLNREAESGTAVYRLTRVGGGWKLSAVEMFEVR
jgi:tetratricopeptide (TPR) repeat protein